METFVWVVVIYLCIEMVAKLTCMAKDFFPPRTKGTAAVDVVVCVAVIVWGFVLLSHT